MNLLENLTPAALSERALQWDHAPEQWQALPDGGIRVYAPAKTDYFREPNGAFINDNAPYLWTSVSGDFVARALIRPEFRATYDSGAFMVRHDAATWGKFCFEKTDFGTTAAVSVVTRGTSDDANGVDLTVSALWMQIFRVGSVFGFHYSLDGESWRMVRLFPLVVPETVRVGLVAQCPVGEGTQIDFLHFSIEARTVHNVRSGE